VIDWRTRLGYYEVGPYIFMNKSRALVYASQHKLPVRWNFNDVAYSSIDWKTPIIPSLQELYSSRAKQIRNKYDYIVLYYSGGADSTQVLHSFIDNGIFLDEIVMQYPKPMEKYFNNTSTDNNNYFSEIKFSAEPHLKKVAHLIHSDTKIRYRDQSEDTFSLFNQDDWHEKYPISTLITPAGAGRQISAINDPELHRLYEKGKTVCQIMGVDKPCVTFNGQEYVFNFVDANATHAVPTDFYLGDIASKYFFLEFFFWTPDFPEIVVKQVQEIKKAAETNITLQEFLRSPGSSQNLDLVRSFFHPIIYNYEANSLVFQVKKPSNKVFRPMDSWFWGSATEDQKQNYLGVIQFFESKIDPKYFKLGTVYNGLNSISSRSYFV